MPDLDAHLPEIVAGDPDAFAAWLAGAEPRVRGSLRSFARSVDTEAVLQETLLRIWQAAPRHRPDGRPDSLLRQALLIARRLAIDEVRRRRRDAPLPEGDAGRLEDPRDAGQGDPLLREAIRKCLSLLRGRPREALLARLRDGGASPDAALGAALGMALNAFLQNVVRARQQVQECLERRGIALGEARP